MGIAIGIGVVAILSLGLLFAVFLGWFRNRGRLIPIEELCPSLIEGKGELPEIRWLGHSSYRIEWGGHVILLDPVLSGRISLAPRLCELPEPEVLDGVDQILITHAHMDHLDNRTLERIAPCDLFHPRNSERFFSNRVINHHQLKPVDLDVPFEVGDLRITPVQARHGGWRYPWQKGHFACGYVISDGSTTLYYAGDTAWGEHFEEIGKVFHPDIAILPIGAYSPQWFLKSRHINPDEAAQAAELLGARWIIPGHFGTFRLSLEPIGESLEWFNKKMPNR